MLFFTFFSFIPLPFIREEASHTKVLSYTSTWNFSDTHNHGLWKRLVALSSDLKCFMLSCCDQLIVCAQKSSPDNYQLKKARICIFAASFIFGGAHLNWDKSFTLHCFFVLSSSLWSNPSRIVHPQWWHVPSQILSRCHNFPLKTWHLFN